MEPAELESNQLRRLEHPIPLPTKVDKTKIKEIQIYTVHTYVSMYRLA